LTHYYYDAGVGGPTQNYSLWPQTSFSDLNVSPYFHDELDEELTSRFLNGSNYWNLSQVIAAFGLSLSVISLAPLVPFAHNED
jgi:hypothetical protein